VSGAGGGQAAPFLSRRAAVPNFTRERPAPAAADRDPHRHPMPEHPQHPMSLTAARERAVKQLGDAFAADAFEMDELESRLSRVYRAVSIAEVEDIVRDVVAPTADQRPVPVATSADLVAPERIGAFMSTTRRGGRWVVPARLELRAFMSDLTIDLRNATLPSEGCAIIVRAVMANVTILVRPGSPVDVDVDAVLASVEDAARLVRAERGLPHVRIGGSAVLSSVEVRAVESPDEDAR
jgi:hypothetical protein